METLELMHKEDMAAELRVSTRTIEAWVAIGRLPRPVHIGRRCVWARPTIEAWKQERLELTTND